MHWLVWNPETGEEEGASTFSAESAADAAEAWAERDDQRSAEYAIVNCRSMPIVYVRSTKPHSPLQRFIVTGRSVAKYDAKEFT